MIEQNRFVVYRQLISREVQRQIVEETLQSQCQRFFGKEFPRNDDDDDNGRSLVLSVQESKNSIKLDLGIDCGSDLSTVLPQTASIARSVFRQASASLDFNNVEALVSMSDEGTPLAGVALLYGLEASMPPHYDSPTQPGKREEWLCMITIGQSVLFRCNDEVLKLESGDVLVMDSMAVLHGVDAISMEAKHHHSDLGLPFPARLGVLFWLGRMKDAKDFLLSRSIQPDDNGEYVEEELSSLFETDD